MVCKIDNINRLILTTLFFNRTLVKSILKPLNPNSIVHFRSRDVTYVTLGTDARVRKLEWWGYQKIKTFLRYRLSTFRHNTGVWKTDRRTDTRRQHSVSRI